MHDEAIARALEHLVSAGRYQPDRVAELRFRRAATSIERIDSEVVRAHLRSLYRLLHTSRFAPVGRDTLEVRGVLEALLWELVPADIPLSPRR
jgi:hypothetical protein